MRYITWIKPTPDLAGMINVEKFPDKQKHPLHCTLWGFYINEAQEGSVVDALNGIKEVPILNFTSGYNYFENKTVILLTRPDSLLRLHTSIVEIARRFDEDTEKFYYNVERFGLERYNPHITVSDSVVQLQGNYENIPNCAISYFLLKKINGIWQNAAEFKLG